MAKVYCDKCLVKLGEYYYSILDEYAEYGLCDKCYDSFEAWMAEDDKVCPDSPPALLPLAEMVKRLLDDTGYSVTRKVHCCTNCETDKYYESELATRIHLIHLQHAFIDYMEGRNG